MVLIGSILILASPPINAEEIILSKDEIKKLKSEMPVLTLKKKQKHPDSSLRYFDAYNLKFNHTDHYFGTYPSKTGNVAAHVFKQKNAKGTILILHGYFDHTGIITPLIELALSEGFSVATIDLPGHGLSDGDRCAINDFKEYSDAVSDFISQYSPDLPAPLHIIAHSTGCSAALEYLSITPENPVKNVIFLGPLVRSYLWGPSKAAFFIVRPFIKKLPRKFRKNSGDEAYLAFVKKDPLEGRYVKVSWFKALSNWNKRIQSYPEIPNNTLVIQGAKDKTVDWKYNIPFLKTIFPNIKIHIIDKGRHQLPNEGKEIRPIVFEQIRNFLKGN